MLIYEMSGCSSIRDSRDRIPERREPMRDGSGARACTLALMLLFLLLPISPGIRGSWDQWRGGPLHHAVEEGEAPPEGELIWSYHTNGQVLSSPVFHNGGMLIGSDDGNLYCFEPESGELRWKFRTGGEIQATALVHEGRAYFGSFDGNLYCISLPGPAGGRPSKIWNVTLEGRILSSCHIFGDSLIAADDEGFIYRISMEGTIEWMRKISDTGFWASPIVDGAGSRGIIGDTGGGLFMFSLEDGRVKETFELPDRSEVYSSGLLRDGVLYIPTGEGRTLIARDLSGGGRDWDLHIENPSYSTPVLRDGRLYIGSFEYMWCIDIEDGNATEEDILWSSPTHDFQGGSSPLVTDRYVLIGSDDHHLYCFDRETGEELWTFSTSGYVYSSPALFNGSVYFGSSDRSVYCIGIRPPGLSVSAFPERKEIAADEVVEIEVMVNSSESAALKDVTLHAVPSAGRISVERNGSESESIPVPPSGKMTLYYMPPYVSSRSSVDIHIEAGGADLVPGNTLVRITVEPAEGADETGSGVKLKEGRGPYIAGSVAVVILNIILLMVLILFRIRDINTFERRESDETRHP
ncbi:MAG TPA: hypothetical protein ENK47_02915 [Euryarchaeota archaeon]|nr:hypothetical protein [Euryarchaeota archaeon]